MSGARDLSLKRTGSADLMETFNPAVTYSTVKTGSEASIPLTRWLPRHLTLLCTNLLI